MAEQKEVRITNLPKCGDICIRSHTYNSKTAYFVNEKVTPPGHYITWPTPFTTIQAALICVAQRNK